MNISVQPPKKASITVPVRQSDPMVSSAAPQKSTPIASSVQSPSIERFPGRIDSAYIIVSPTYGRQSRTNGAAG